MLCVQEGTTTTLPGKKVESRNYKTHILEFNVQCCFFNKKIEMTVSTVMYFGIFLGVL